MDTRDGRTHLELRRRPRHVSAVVARRSPPVSSTEDSTLPSVLPSTVGPVTRHHYVPQLYLRRFADGDKQVVLVDRDDPGRSVTKTVKQALHLDDFYGWDPGLAPDEVDDPAVLDPEHIERLLSVFESRAAGAFERMIETGNPPATAKDRYHLTHFIALQAVRGQRFREDMSQAATYEMRKHMLANSDPDRVRDWLAERGEPHDPDDVARFIDSAYGSNGPRLVPDQTFAIQQALGFAMKQVAPTLWSRSWLVVTFDEPCLLTSDEPIVAFHPEDEPVTVMTAPFVLVAVDRRHLLVMRQLAAPQAEPDHGHELTPEDGPDDTEPVVADRYRSGTPEEAAHFNSLVATQAEQSIVHHPEDAALIDALVLGPRTEWGEEILETVQDGDKVTVRGRVKRVPVR